MSKKKIFEKDSNLANEDSGCAANEYEHEPVPEHKAKGLKSFLGLFGFEPRFHDPESCVRADYSPCAIGVTENVENC